MNMRWVRIASYSSPHEASLALSVLEGSGIEAKVFNQISNGVMPHLSQMIMADLMVQESSVRDALEVLGIDSNTSMPANEQSTPEQQSIRFQRGRRVIAVGAFVLVAIIIALKWYKDS
jgi:hypothetical protein